MAIGATREEAENNMYEAIEIHIQGLLLDKFPIPESNKFAEQLTEKSGMEQMA